jgi:predicted NUDIX family phosphoesterase
MSEIAVIPVSTLRTAGYVRHGFWSAPRTVLTEFDGWMTAMHRPSAEVDLTVKQPIAYAVVRRGDEVYVMERLTGGVEARLHGVLTLGVGGHVDAPFAPSQRVEDAMRREWTEEVACTAEPEWRWLGLVNDDEIAVGRHHIGCVFEARLPLDAEVSVLETNKLRGYWSNISALRGERERLETWSAFVLDALTGDGG